MNKTTKAAFLLLALVAWLTPGVARAEGGGSCSISLDYSNGDPDCPLLEFSGSCPSAAACWQALGDAEDECWYWENYFNRIMALEGFECIDPTEPPTDFTFRCVHWQYPCIG